ncbi:MAG: DNA-formamidopyrimidine glycosylase [Solirubrobacteraceae bacterium]|nr:DNA-formamidopyrimidine glycosylase [Solirubrobacteraceae bacterium]
MPELPEVEIVARRATAALAGRRITSVSVVGFNALRSLDPPPGVLEGATVTEVQRRGKLLLLDTDGDHLLLIHLMTGGGMTWKAGKVNPRDRAMRVVVRFDDDDPPLRIRERGTRQAMWVRAIRRADLDAGEIAELAKLGPEAWWPDGAESNEQIAQIAAALDQPRPLHSLLRDNRSLAGVGRTWSDEILWAAHRSPYQRGSDLTVDERTAFAHLMRDVLEAALEHYERKIPAVPAEKLTKPVQVHGKVGEACPSCGATLRGVFFESHTIAYCPTEQTGGKVLKDRRLSRLGIEATVDED